MKEQIKSNLKYLDGILDCLIKNQGLMLGMEELEKKIAPPIIQYIGDTGLIVPDYSEKIDKTFFLAIKFLLDNKMVSVSINEQNSSSFIDNPNLTYNHKVTISFEGIIKLSDGGFCKEYKRNNNKYWLQVMVWTVSVVTFVFGILTPLIKGVFDWLK